VRDLTERKIIDERARQNEERFRFLVESVKDYAIFMLDPMGNVASWNAGAERIKGYRADEIIGRHFSAFYPEEDIRAGKTEMELEVASREGRFEDEGWRVRKDGSRFWANVIITALYDQDGALVGFGKVTRDLTERREAELDRLALAHTQEALRLRDEFLSIAAHELRTPLVALQLQIDSLQMQSARLEPRQAAKVERASRNVQRLSDLISALLDVARISQGRLTITPRPIDLGTLVEEVIDRLHESASEAKCRVVADIVPGVAGSWDPLRIGQVISNLLANAFKYAAGTPVEVSLVRDGDMAILRVQDRGPGIPPNELERIFGRFERAASIRSFGGMGLGLYVAREIVTAHNGEIIATNREVGGAMLEVRLPIQ
jgi:PAS domain S-box-containing protein